MVQTTTRALVLARGLGTRMQRPDADAALTDAQRRAADAGLKALMPIDGRPFLDYVLSSLADAGVTRVGLVVAPRHEPLSGHYAAHPPSRVSLEFIVQPEAIGTANALLAAESWTEGHPFLVMNGDNLYPVQALADLAFLDEPGLPAFDADDLVRSSNIPEERIRAFALIEIDAEGYLSGIIEKPTTLDLPPEGGSHSDLDLPPEGGSHLAPGVASGFSRKMQRVSMNCWRFDARIFSACRDVPKSARGEYELPEAVGLAIRRGVRMRAIPARGPVLDLSSRADAGEVERRLAGLEPRP